MPALAKTAICACQKMFLPPLAFSKPGVILIPLEVYMVNSPSRPNVRPVDPPPLGRPARTPFLCPLPASTPRAGRGRPRHRSLAVGRSMLVVGCFGNQPSIKAKNPAIKANRASSRQMPFFRQPTRWMGRTGWRMVKTCAKVLPLPSNGEGRGEGVRHHQSIPFCSPAQPIKAKNPAIKPYQGISRQTMIIFKSIPQSPLRAPVTGCWAFTVGCWMFPLPGIPPMRLRLCAFALTSPNSSKNRLANPALPW